MVGVYKYTDLISRVYQVIHWTSLTVVIASPWLSALVSQGDKSIQPDIWNLIPWPQYSLPLPTLTLALLLAVNHAYKILCITLQLLGI